MTFESQTLYAKSANRHFLVLNTTKFGICIAYINNQADNAYKSMPELFINGAGYVEFDRVYFISWHKFTMWKSCKVARISNRTFKAIVNAISDLMLGEIVYSNDMYMYADEIIESSTGNDTSEKNLEEIVEPSSDINEVENVLDNTIEDEKAADDDTAEILDKIDVVKDPSDSTIEDETATNCSTEDDTHSDEDDKIDIESAENIEDVRTVHDMSNIDIGADDFIVICDNERYYDLFASEFRNNANNSSSKYPAKRASHKRKYRNNRHLFTESEVLSISMMTIPTICATYNVTKSSGSIMRNNARTIMNMNDGSSRKPINDFYAFFDQNYTVKQVSEITGTPLVSVNNSYKRYLLRNNSSDTTHLKEKYIDCDVDYVKLIEIDNMQCYDFAVREGITYDTARSLKVEIKHKLSINPYYASGFGADSFDLDTLKAKVDARRAFSDISSIIYVNLYDKISKLWDVYHKSINQHHNIISGLVSVTEFVDAEDADSFYSMIWNRFNRNLLKDVRMLSFHQKRAISNRNVVRVADLFMCQYEQARYLCYNKFTLKYL